ncbi:phosphotransferase enzyme family protein [Paenibacillus mendelii]|uniref:Phosphotransferase enzyme family protein n=1 Tax=Paenibacillus mendelii TaxID=206163 RepID=A0ABV6J6J7_9BACL|nr:phosphotransferase [Paenibacillus mendelii]MCQ6561234.1 phosphotransferase [Paenibacillus mendelii]
MIPDHIKADVFAQLGCQPSEAKLLGGYNNNVYEINRGKDIVVKIVDRSIVAESRVLAELEWLVYLNLHGLSVVRPVHLIGDTYIQPISDGYYLIAYDKVIGTPINSQESRVWNDELFGKWGEMMGKMHTLAKSYQAVHQRPQWFEQDLFNEEAFHSDPLLAGKWKQYHNDLIALTTSKDSYGLIHGDLHQHNLLLRDQEITLLDFGDCEYNWFAYDIAIVMYHTAQTVPEGPHREKFIKSFFTSFMEGYTKENSTTSFVPQIDYFIDYRHFYSYAYHTAYADKSQLTEAQLRFLDEMRLSLINRDSYLGFSIK